ncbi:hypothetical protein [Aquimarina litoralis]|uniref:hypothetical protein n=1 Tax=Aquimarina litoralis TaxID=584605 RepID=UPI001C58FD48|nr:hypothetical protein [Aquimarina litoralis]
MKKLSILVVLASMFVACENESFEDAVFNEDITVDTEETNDNEGEDEIIVGDE